MTQPSIENLEFIFLGQSYKIRCPRENQMLLEMASEKLQDQLDKLSSKNTPYEKQAIMAGLLLAFDSLKIQNEIRATLQELQALKKELLSLNLNEPRTETSDQNPDDSNNASVAESMSLSETEPTDLPEYQINADK